MAERKRKFSQPQQEDINAEEGAGADQDELGASGPQTRGESLGGEGESQEENPERK